MTPTMFDAVTLEVLWTRIISIVDEAAKAIVRTSFSTLSNEANDFACILTDARGGALAQNRGSIPSFIGTLPATVRHFLREMGPARIHPGDVLITNDAWMGTGHMSDVSVLSRSSTATGSSRFPRPRPTCRTSEGASAPSRREKSSRKACTSHLPNSCTRGVRTRRSSSSSAPMCERPT